MPQLPVANLLDRQDVNLPGATGRSFWLNGSAWEYPDFENAEAFVARLVKRGVIARDRAVEDALRGEYSALSRRSVQRHFLAGHGHDPQYFSPIERARYADEPPEARRLHSRCRPRGWVLRPGTPDPLAQTSDRPNPGEDYWPGRAAVVFIQNNPLFDKSIVPRSAGRSEMHVALPEKEVLDRLERDAGFERRRTVPKIDTYLSFNGPRLKRCAPMSKFWTQNLEVLMKFGDAPSGMRGPPAATTR